MSGSDEQDQKEPKKAVLLSAGLTAEQVEQMAEPTLVDLISFTDYDERLVNPESETAKTSKVSAPEDAERHISLQKKLRDFSRSKPSGKGIPR